MNKLDKQYQELLKDILENGTKKTDRTGVGTVSVFGRTIRHKMSDGFPLLTTKKMYFKGVITELLWFLNGDTNIKYLLDNNCHIWNGDAYKNYLKLVDQENEKTRLEVETLRSKGKLVRVVYLEKLSLEKYIEKIKTDSVFCSKYGNLGPIYGHQWRNFNGVDQITDVINQLKTNPDSRRLLVSAWNPEDLPKQVLPPCHTGFQFYTRELSFEERINYANNLSIKEPKRAISLRWNQRSVDVPLGLPFNIASYALLLQIVGQIVNMVPEELIGDLGDTHIYTNQIEPIKQQLDREPFQLPKLNINTEFWLTQTHECGVGELISNIDSLIKSISIDDFNLMNYVSHPKIDIPLSN